MNITDKVNAIKALLVNDRITKDMIKPFSSIQSQTFAKSRILIDMARDFGPIDGLKANASDAEVMAEYKISAGDNTDVDPRIALAILINKGNNETIRAINTLLRQAVMTTAASSSDSGNPPATEQVEVRNDASAGLWLEVKNDLPLDNPISKVHICTLGNELPWNKPKMFPKESRIKLPWNDVNDYLISCIKQSSDVLKSDKLICINDLIAASGVDTNIGQWGRTDSAQTYLDAVANIVGKPREDIIITRRGGSDGKRAWAHVYVAIEIARWIDPYFSVMVNDIVLRVMGGDLSLIPQIADQHDALNGTVTNVVSVAAGNTEQVRQTTTESKVFDFMNEDEAARQVRLNAQQAAFNHSVWRELNFDIPMTKGMLYERDTLTNRWLIAKEPDGRNPKVAVECMLKALKPEAFKNNNITTLYDCIELMWFMIANYENSIAAIEDANDARGDEPQLSEDARDKIAELEKTVKGLRSQITNITNASRLRPLIDGVIKSRNRGNNPDVDLNAICHLIDSILNGDNVDPSAVMATNWHLTYGLGQDLKSHRDFRNLVAVVNDIADILRADIGSEEYKVAIPKSFGDVFAPADQRNLDAQAPSYWQTLSLPDVNAFTCVVADQWVDDDQNDVQSTPMPKGPDPENTYALLTPLVATKKRTAPTRSAIAKKSELMPDELRAALLKHIEDSANSLPMSFTNVADEYMLHLYVGQLGWAGNIVPKRYTAAPSLVLLISMREILDAGAWHFRPAGQLTLVHPMTVGKAIAKLSTTLDAYRKPLVQSVNQGSVSMTMPYDVTKGAPHSTIKQMASSIVAAIGKTSVSTMLYPDDEFGATWRVITPCTM